jgi:Mg-chelatase subunit ChlD
MNPDSPQTPPDAREARLTALLLGELSAAEAEVLRAEIAADAELGKLFRRLSVALDLTRETIRTPEPKELARPESLQLSSGRRDALLAQFKARPSNVVPLPKPKRQPRFDYRELIAVAAMLVAVLGAAGMLLPALSKAKLKGSSALAARAPETEDFLAATDAPAAAALEMSLGGAKAGETRWRGAVSRQLNESLTPPPSVPTRPMDPTLARHYGLAPKEAAKADTASVISVPSVPSSSDQAGAAAANSQSDFGEVADNGRERTFARNQIALPQAEQPLVRDSTAASARGFWDEQTSLQRGQGAGAGGGLAAENRWAFNQPLNLADRLSDGLSVAGNLTTETTRLDDLARLQPGVAGGAFGGGNQSEFYSFPPATSSPATVSTDSFGFAVTDPAPAQFSVPVAGESKAQEQIVSADFLRVAPGQEAERLGRMAGRRGVEDRKSEVASGDLPSSKGTALSTVAGVEVANGTTAPLAVNGPSLRNRSLSQTTDNLAALSFGENAARLNEANTDAPVEFYARAALQPADGRELADKQPSPVALGVELALPRIESSESRSADSGTEYFAKTKADPATKDVLELKRVGQLADLEAGQTVAAAGKPVTMLGFDVATATNAALPVLGDVPVLGSLFKQTETVERINGAFGSAPDSATLARLGIDFETLNRMRGAVAALTNKLSELDQQTAAKQAIVGQLAQNLAESQAPQADIPLPKLAPGAPEPQPEVATADNAFSTFSLNVSDVSFKLAAAALEKGQMPEPATVRTEEFINAFDYRDPEPAGAAPIAFAWERARYPFAHDRDLVRFSVKTAASGRAPGRPLNLVLLLDNSGSMERADRVRIRQECLRVLAGQLQPHDRVSVVAFARTPRLWVDGLPGAQAAELPGRVGELTPDGGTNLEEALRTAYQTASRHFAANGVNRVVLLTDGAANLGDVQPESLKRQVETNRQQGIALDCFGIGWEGLNDELLEVLSRNGDGRYGFVNTPEAAQSEFAGQLVGALQVAASDVKVQVEWNPRRVTAYRQLGYAKHQLTKEQFRDNTVDAAEIGAAEAGNALYTVQVNPAGEGPLGAVRVRFKVPGTGDYREHEWPLNYDGTARPLEQSGPALRLAASASAFSEWLVSSPHAAEVTPDRLLGLLNGVTDTYAADPRPKQFEQMLRQAKSVSGR